MIVVYTNVVSELMRPSPAAEVLAWLEAVPPQEIATTTITVAEITYGLTRLPAGKRTRRLQAAAVAVWDTIGDAILPFDVAAAEHYGELVAAQEAAGTPMSGFDAQIAAIALAHDAALATRNISDFEQTGLRLINPWDKGADPGHM